MPFDTILRPDNRLLGWSTGDFSLYGAQPTAATVTARTIDAPATVRSDTPDGTVSPADRADQSDFLAPASVEHADDAQSDNGSTAAAPPTAPSAPAEASHDVAAVVAPQGGSTAFDLIAQPTTIDHIAPDGSPTPDPVQAVSTGPLADSVASLADVTSPLAAVTGQLAGVTAQLAQTDALVHGVTDTAAGAVDDVLSSVTAAQGGLTDLLAGLTGADGAVDAIGHAPTLDIDQMIFSGSDPIGGITTLVGMVQTSELFSIGQDAGLPAAPDASGSIVDDLASEVAAVAPLMGDDHHDDLIDPPDLHLGL